MTRFAALALLLAALSPALGAQSLYVDGADPYAAVRRFQIGDMIEISIDENLTANRQSQQAVTKQLSLNAGFNGNTASGAGIMTQASLGQSGSGSGSTMKSDQLLATVTVRVTAIEPDGTLDVKGEQEVDLDGETQHMSLSGLLKPEDVGLDRSADSQRLANVQFHLENKGTAARGGTLGWLQWLLSWVGL